MNKKSPTVLIILDGFGYSTKTKYNAIYQAHPANFNKWFAHYPHAILQAAGTAVGLLPGYIGNSEVGHLTIGSGRVIDQPSKIMHTAIENGSFFTNKKLVDNLDKLAQSGKTLHIMGLLSNAGVHSNLEDLFAFLKTAHQQKVKHVVVHAFLDGRDTDPKSATRYLTELDTQLKKFGGVLGSVQGRFYAMDRDKNWSRTEKSYRELTEQQHIKFADWQEVLKHYYAQNITDEFIPPTQLRHDALIKNGDGVIFYNYRPDRARQLTECFVNPNFKHFPIKHIKLAFFIIPVSYDMKLNATVLFNQPTIDHTLKDVLAEHGKSIFSIAETEKYAHVTYFFNGGREKKEADEIWKLIPSIRAKTYIDYPCMSAPEITKAVIESLTTKPADFYLINYANADMVGHSGNLEATIKAVQCLDKRLGALYDQVITQMDGTMYITADHGNAEDMYDEKTHQPRTSHTANPVPFIMIRKNLEGNSTILPLEKLSDIAPFILKNMHLPVPKEMIK